MTDLATKIILSRLDKLEEKIDSVADDVTGLKVSMSALRTKVAISAGVIGTVVSGAFAAFMRHFKV